MELSFKDIQSTIEAIDFLTGTYESRLFIVAVERDFAAYRTFVARSDKFGLARVGGNAINRRRAAARRAKRGNNQT